MQLTLQVEWMRKDRRMCTVIVREREREGERERWTGLEERQVGTSAGKCGLCSAGMEGWDTGYTPRAEGGMRAGRGEEESF